MNEFFNAKHIAVVGAAREEWKVGHSLLKNLLQNKAIRVFPINPNAEEILGVRCYRDLIEVPFSIDLAVIAVKAEFVSEIMRQAVQKKVKSVILITAGFSEAGNSKLEKEIAEIAEKGKIRLLGPNILGIINPYKNLNASFFEGMPEKGEIAFLSQSGALGVGVLDLAIKERIGLSGFVSLGNCAMLDASDFIEYFGNDPHTKVITLYIESLKDGRGKRFIEICKKVSKHKKIIAIKAGKSLAGIKAAQSHTAALASEAGVYESIFKQAGVIEVESLKEMFKVAKILSKKEVGKKALIVTNAGGLGVLTTDALEKNRIEVAELPEKIKIQLNKFLPTSWSHNNPVDVLGDAQADRYREVLNLLDRESFFDFFVVLLTPQHMTQVQETAELLVKLKKPVFACFVGGNKISSAKSYLEEKSIIVFDDAKELGEILGKCVQG